MLNEGDGRSIQYNFAHKALPMLALWNPNKFYKDVFNKNGNRYLNEIWEGLSGRMEVTEFYSFPPVEVGKLSSGIDSCLITLPTPEDLLEAYYIAVTVSVEKKLFRKQVSALRYFTLGLSYDPESQNERYHVCEWQSPTPRPNRTNYGTIPLISKSLFIGIIEAILSGEITAYIEPEESQRNKFVRPERSGTLLFKNDHPTTPEISEVSDTADLTNSMGRFFLHDFYQTQSEVLPEFQEEYNERIAKIERWAGVQNGCWSEAQMERFVRQYERYVGEKFPSLQSDDIGEPLSPVLREVFEAMIPLDRTNEE